MKQWSWKHPEAVPAGSGSQGGESSRLCLGIMWGGGCQKVVI